MYVLSSAGSTHDWVAQFSSDTQAWCSSQSTLDGSGYLHNENWIAVRWQRVSYKLNSSWITRNSMVRRERLYSVIVLITECIWRTSEWHSSNSKVGQLWWCRFADCRLEVDAVSFAVPQPRTGNCLPICYMSVMRRETTACVSIVSRGVTIDNQYQTS